MPATPFHVFLSHGLESGPGGTKVQALKAVAETFEGAVVQALDHRNTRDPAQRLQQMQNAMIRAGARPERTLLAGSSMGGWVCARTSELTPVLGCFLLAPALALPDYPESKPTIGATHTRIIHGWNDEVVPVMPVLELARQQQLETLVLADGHRLEDSVPRIAQEFRSFIERCLGE
ncbi:alpha/beta hydrolase [Marinobacter fuscus]|uniref:Alpha/beta hydrolase n=1 Tax=Marinobacter fuscus TaxID=2109942 RepID=A0A2T1KT87_9GAMM|nr:YqiA/YcfP family alpha/beta fold hydrolase [Marinobacter fuscus]PSF13308.1 alpha/beta hydrolase [Marinobacter fuscus]